jgi:hypothetical protein
MRRRAFDTILTTGGLVVTAVLLIAGGLLMWGSNFASGNVHDQLAEQQIVFPAKGSPALAPADVGPYLNKYAGQKLTTGQQAKAYADHFIKVHAREVAGGKTYAQVSTAAQADPTNTQLQQQTQTLFRAETLRGLLLSAYAFGKIGQIAKVAAVASFVLSGVMLVLALLGFAHLRRVSPAAEVFGGEPSPAQERVAVMA